MLAVYLVIWRIFQAGIVILNLCKVIQAICMWTGQGLSWPGVGIAVPQCPRKRKLPPDSLHSATRIHLLQPRRFLLNVTSPTETDLLFRAAIQTFLHILLGVGQKNVRRSLRGPPLSTRDTPRCMFRPTGAQVQGSCSQHHSTHMPQLLSPQRMRLGEVEVVFRSYTGKQSLGRSRRHQWNKDNRGTKGTLAQHLRNWGLRRSGLVTWETGTFCCCVTMLFCLPG